MSGMNDFSADNYVEEREKNKPLRVKYKALLIEANKIIEDLDREVEQMRSQSVWSFMWDRMKRFIESVA